jgi:hypothetical protein
MVRLIERKFTVPVTLADAWDFLGRVEQRPVWAKHIRRIEVHPPGELTPESSGCIVLRNGIKSTFRMREFNPGRNWKWVGSFLWLTVHYDHRFDEEGGGHTCLTWTIDAEGLGAQGLGRLFAVIYSHNLNKAIPALQAEISRR